MRRLMLGAAGVLALSLALSAGIFFTADSAAADYHSVEQAVQAFLTLVQRYPEEVPMEPVRALMPELGRLRELGVEEVVKGPCGPVYSCGPTNPPPPPPPPPPKPSVLAALSELERLTSFSVPTLSRERLDPIVREFATWLATQPLR